MPTPMTELVATSRRAPAAALLGAAIALAALFGCEPPPVAAPACPAEPLVAYGGFIADGALEVVVIAPFMASSSVRQFDAVQPQDVTGAALLHQSGDNYLRVSVLPEVGATEVEIRTEQICAPSGTDPTDGSLHPHLSLIVELPADHAEGVPVHVAIEIDGEG